MALSQKPEPITDREAISAVYHRPLLDLIFDAARLHRTFHDPHKIQVSSLISVKTGGCPEDCGYCPQAARYNTGVKKHGLLDVEEVVEHAKKARAGGSSRVCMGAAWRQVRDNKDFDKVIEMVRAVNGMGLEVCCTLGMLTEAQAQRLKEAGLYAYNHNVDTSEEHYGEVISTRTYDDRLATLKNARKASLTVCSGGIIGLGETAEDRIGMLWTLANLNPPPESVPINALVPVPGTPLEEQELVSIWEMVRMVATARIVIPSAMVRLSAGRLRMSPEGQSLCFLAGANSIFSGDKLLTTPNPDYNADLELFEQLGLQPCEPFDHRKRSETTSEVEAALV